MIGIIVGLPLSAADGGTGGVQGAWNGRTQSIGGGVYQGVLSSVTGATDAGYAGSNTDTGHRASPLDGSWALNPDKSLNFGLINDFSFNGIHEQAIWTKKLVKMYYGQGPKFSYWNGCSTGGRQGHMQAQRFPNDFDGILAGAPAFNWDRFIPSEQWGEIATNQEVGAPISSAKLVAAQKASLAACDGLDGITDGIIQDPRACKFSAKSLMCTGSPSDPATCLTAAEASAVDKIWDGPTGAHGEQLWFGLERGTVLGALNGPSPFPISNSHLVFWVNQNPSFDWHTLTEATFQKDFFASEVKFHDAIGTDNPDLSEFKEHGAKMITYHGLADLLIMPRGTYNYYNRVTHRMGGIKETQKFYRFFPYPSNSHCGPDVANYPQAPAINSPQLFNALVNWVEHGVAPDTITATSFNGQVTRPICKYPDTLVYNGSGSTNVASNFHCQVSMHDPLKNAERVIPDVEAFDHDRDDR
jgi:hypothetical protein